MCGICGFTGSPDDNTLKKMTRELTHRGPDDEGFYADGEINLGMRRLSIIDIEGGKQPIHNEDKTLWVVFNGEIYNHVELRQNLIEKGHYFHTDHSDTEVIVHLYEEYGLDFVHKLNGMFAIALWDKKTKSLFLIRDRMGVKPLFYYVKNGSLIFSSEIKSILAHPAYSKDISHEGISHYFNFKHVPAPFTAFKRINCLKPGELLKFKNRDLNIHRYWKVKFKENRDFLNKEQDVIEELFKLLTDATKIRMRSDVPIGAYLSGGVDSSCVVALMARITNNKNIKTFSLGYEDEIKNKEDDVYFAIKVSEMYGTTHHKYTMSSEELKEDIHEIIHAFDQPFSGVVSTFFLTKLISKHVKVALSGDGADELFGSYLSHRLAPVIAYCKEHKNNGFDIGDERLALFKDNLSFPERLLKETGGDTALWRYQILPFGNGKKDSLFTDAFLEKTRSRDCTLDFLRAYLEDTTSTEPLNRMLEMEWNSFFPDQVLAFVDFLSMAHSVEIRSPFIDYRLAEFAATIPSELKIKGDVVKYILKKCIDEHDILPEGITGRPKEGFVLPVYRWIDGPLKGWVLDLLSRKRIERGGLLRYDTIEEILNGHYSGAAKKHAEVWNLVIFQVWWERYFG
jgi:asparagine synthase (glutamine-hydrolysing)